MNKTIFFLVFSMIACSTPVNKDSYKILVTEYVLGSPRTFEDTVNVEKIDSLDVKKYIYNYDKLRMKKDTLVMTNNSVSLNNTELTFVSTRNMSFKGKPYVIRKYIYDNVRTSSNIFINQNDGIVLWTVANLSFTVMEYDNKLSEVSKQILKDSVFALNR